VESGGNPLARIEASRIELSRYPQYSQAGDTQVDCRQAGKAIRAECEARCHVRLQESGWNPGLQPLAYSRRQERGSGSEDRNRRGFPKMGQVPGVGICA